MAGKGAAVQVEGLNKLIRSLTLCGVETTELKSAMSKGSILLANALRAETPVKTGLLASTVRKGTAKSKAVARIGGSRPKHYAPFVNYGTKRQPKQLFTYKALEKSRLPALQAVDRDLTRIIRKYGLN